MYRRAVRHPKIRTRPSGPRRSKGLLRRGGMRTRDLPGAYDEMTREAYCDEAAAVISGHGGGPAGGQDRAPGARDVY